LAPEATAATAETPQPAAPGATLAPLKKGIGAENPVLIQVLGVCSALAVTSRVDTTLVMCASLLFVGFCSCLAISLLRTVTPRRVRMITYMLVISTFVIVADQYLKAAHFELSKALGPYVGLIITNCILMGRCEAYASRNPPIASALDGAGNGLGYGLVLLAISLVREPLGSGTLLGWEIGAGDFRLIPAGYECQLMGMAPGAFFAMAVLVWVVRSKWPAAEVED
jgi:Na+-transporting NADH:ubiquinone oxidoreductase subunit D